MSALRKIMVLLCIVHGIYELLGSMVDLELTVSDFCSRFDA